MKGTYKRHHTHKHSLPHSHPNIKAEEARLAAMQSPQPGPASMPTMGTASPIGTSPLGQTQPALGSPQLPPPGV